MCVSSDVVGLLDVRGGEEPGGGPPTVPRSGRFAGSLSEHRASSIAATPVDPSQTVALGAFQERSLATLKRIAHSFAGLLVLERADRIGDARESAGTVVLR